MLIFKIKLPAKVRDNKNETKVIILRLNFFAEALIFSQTPRLIMVSHNEIDYR